MEDSGYYSRRSSEFKFSGSAPRGSSSRIPTLDDIFKLSFKDLSLPKYSYFKYGFTDEEDFEEFKENLKHFRKLKREVTEDEEIIEKLPTTSEREAKQERNRSDSLGTVTFPEFKYVGRDLFTESLPSVSTKRNLRFLDCEDEQDREFDQREKVPHSQHTGESCIAEDLLENLRSSEVRSDNLSVKREGLLDFEPENEYCQSVKKSTPVTSDCAGLRDVSDRWTTEQTTLKTNTDSSSALDLWGGEVNRRGRSGSGSCSPGIDSRKRNAVYIDKDLSLEEPQLLEKFGELSDVSDFKTRPSVSSGKCHETKRSLSDDYSQRKREHDCVKRVSFHDTPEVFTWTVEPNFHRQRYRRSESDSSSKKKSSEHANTTSEFSEQKDLEDNFNPTEQRVSTPKLNKNDSSCISENKDCNSSERKTCVKKSSVENVPIVDVHSWELSTSSNNTAAVPNTPTHSSDSLKLRRSTEYRELQQTQVVDKTASAVVNISIKIIQRDQKDTSSTNFSKFQMSEKQNTADEKKTSRVETTTAPVNLPIRYTTSDGRTTIKTPIVHKSCENLGKYCQEDQNAGSRYENGERSRTFHFDKDDQRSSYRVPKKANLLENLKRGSSHERPGSRRFDSLMEFLSDEHFQEFDRVFETVNNHRFSRDLDIWPCRLWREDSVENKSSYQDDLGVLHIDETFMDFFDKDEDFMEFERELEKIKSNRRSRLLENLSRRPSCDIISDVKAFCDRSLRNSRTPSSSPSPELPRRNAPSDKDLKEENQELWNSAEDWEAVINKLKRHSRMFSENAEPARTEDFSYKPASGSQSRPLHSEHCPCYRDCQYTCHLNCVPSVTLDCTTVSPGSGGSNVATPTDLPSPSGTLSAETSLIDRRRVVNHKPLQATSSLPDSTSSEQASRSVQNCYQSSRSDTFQRTSSLPKQHSHVLSSLSGVSVSSNRQDSHLLHACVEKDLNENAKVDISATSVNTCSVTEENVCDTPNEKDETDSGYRSGTIPDEQLPKPPGQATLTRQERRRKIQSFNHYVPKAALEECEDGETFQGFLKVTLNLIRPITMELGARPPSIYELLTREHIVEQSTQHVAFYMPRDTVKSIHVTSKITTKEVVTGLLKKFHILDHPRKFAMYEQEFNEKNKLVKLRRLTDKDCPLLATLSWDPERIKFYRLVLQENETGEIVWDAFSFPELNNFLKVLDREEGEAVSQLQYKYRVMKRIICQRLKELRKERQAASAGESVA